MKKTAVLTALFVCACFAACFAGEPQQDVLEQAPEAEEARGAKVAPKKVEVDSNFDGTPDRTELYDSAGRIARVEADTNADGKADTWIVYEGGMPVQEQRDSNGDGKPDVWIEY